VLATVERERESVRAERDAFEEFATTVKSLPAGSPQSVEAPPGLTASAGKADPLGTVRDCYRETVMAVPDYDEEYGESLREHMTAEFGEVIATAVVGGGELTPRLRQGLVDGARAIARRRGTLRDVLDTEYEAVRDARGELREIDATLERVAATDPADRSFAELVDEGRDLRRDERRCEGLLERRQREIHRETRRFRRSDDLLLQEYLNADLEVTFPVLDATLERLSRLRDHRRSVVRSLTRRP